MMMRKMPSPPRSERLKRAHDLTISFCVLFFWIDFSSSLLGRNQAKYIQPLGHGMDIKKS